ncbi:hypothetical protein BGZ83_011978 [Gryganskiella cystojenkinii]|nr:hypothetical protein BGZ83_011978 [Gryganskiella cystojenkinii]
MPLPFKFKVIIAGGGIAGLSLGVMLERAGIDFLILEAREDVQPLGAVISIQPSVMKVMEQLGLMDDLVRQSNVMTGVNLLDHKLSRMCHLDVGFAGERYGYDTLTIVRPKLYDILLSRIPAYKILFSKRVISTVQNKDGVKIRCKDGSQYSGDILVAADGGDSPIREAIYDEIRRRSPDGKMPHPSDSEKPKVEQRCIAGVTQPMSLQKYPVLGSKNCEMMLVMPKEYNCMVWFVPMAENRFGWAVTTPVPRLKKSKSSSSVASKKLSKMKSSDRVSLESSSTTTSHTEQGYHYPRHDSKVTTSTSDDMGAFSGISSSSYSPPSSPVTPGSRGVAYFENGISGLSDDDDDDLDYLNERINSISLTAEGRPRYDSRTNSNGGNSTVNGNIKDDQTLRKRLSSGLVTMSNGSTVSQKSAGGSGEYVDNEAKAKAFRQYPNILDANDGSLDHLTIKNSDRIWNQVDPRYSIKDTFRNQLTPYGGTLGDMIDATSKKMMSMVVTEEKFYHCWHFGRTILMGDACHTLLISSGHGPTQAILDAISLASLLVDLPSNSVTDVDALFRLHYQRRGPDAKFAVLRSKDQDQLFFNRRLTGKIMRKMASNWVAERLKVKLGDQMYDARPMLHFLQSVPDRGTHPNKDKTLPLTKDRRFEIARRKSISSGYIKTTKHSEKESDDDRVDHLIFDTTAFSASTPSILLPAYSSSLANSYSHHHNIYSNNAKAIPPVPPIPQSLRPMSSLMNIEGFLIPNQYQQQQQTYQSKRREGHLDQPYLESKATTAKTGHWHMYD